MSHHEVTSGVRLSHYKVTSGLRMSHQAYACHIISVTMML